MFATERSRVLPLWTALAASAVVLAGIVTMVSGGSRAGTTTGGHSSPLFTEVRLICAGSDFVAFQGDDDWLPNKNTREKLMIFKWRAGLQSQTILLDRQGNYAGIRCVPGRVDLLAIDTSPT